MRTERYNIWHYSKNVSLETSKPSSLEANKGHSGKIDNRSRKFRKGRKYFLLPGEVMRLTKEKLRTFFFS